MNGTLEIPSYNNVALPAPPNPFANVPGFNQGGSGCFPTGCDYPQPQQRWVWTPPRLPSGGGQQGVCWWCNPSGGLQTTGQPWTTGYIPNPSGGQRTVTGLIPQSRQPFFQQTTTGILQQQNVQPFFQQNIPPPPPVIMQQQQQQQYVLPSRQQNIVSIPIVSGPPVAQGGTGKQPSPFIPAGNEGGPLSIQAGGIGPTVPVGPYLLPAFQYNPTSGFIFVPTFKPYVPTFGKITAGPAGVPSFGSVPSPGLPGGGPTGGIGVPG